MSDYSLIIKNNSKQKGSFCIYQTVPNQDKNLFSLAWFSKSCNPETKLTFKWTLDYCFNWSETGTLKPGITFNASETMMADPNDITMNSVGFSKNDQGYLFTETKKTTSEGSLGIHTDGTIPNNKASIGIGMSDNAAFAVDAAANMNYIFNPHPMYWVSFGSYTEGFVLDLNTVSNPQKVIYPNNVNLRTLTFTNDNTWEFND